MARQKLTDNDVARLRDLWTQGWSAPDLAAEFSISRQHVGRLVREEQRAVAVAGREVAIGDVSAAVDEFLDGAELRGGDEVLAATARALAVKLDACTASEAVAAAAAAPRLAAELAEVLDRLRGTAVYQPDKLDELRARIQAKRRAAGAPYDAYDVTNPAPSATNGRRDRI
jgi:hypothetical protein